MEKLTRPERAALENGFYNGTPAEPVTGSSMGDLRARVHVLRAALAGLLGASTRAELKELEAAIRVIPGAAADRVVALNAIHAMLATED